MTPWWKCLHHEVHDLPPAGFTLTSVTVHTPESTCSSIFMHCCSPRLSRLQFAEFLPSSGHRYTSPVCFFPVDSKGAPTSNLQPCTQFETQTLFIMQKSRILEKEGLVFEADTRTPVSDWFYMVRYPKPSCWTAARTLYNTAHKAHDFQVFVGKYNDLIIINKIYYYTLSCELYYVTNWT